MTVTTWRQQSLPLDTKNFLRSSLFFPVLLATGTRAHRTNTNIMARESAGLEICILVSEVSHPILYMSEQSGAR
jgi:hypothetical protein